MDNDICAICLDENNEDNFVCNYCNNVFHNTCIKNMNNNYCPLCRKELHNTSYNYKNYIFNNMSNLDDNTENNNKNKYKIIDSNNDIDFNKEIILKKSKNLL